MELLPAMRFLHLFFAIFVLVSLAKSGYGKAEVHCTKVRFCSTQCSKVGSCSIYCKYKRRCSLMPGWKKK